MSYKVANARQVMTMVERGVAAGLVPFIQSSPGIGKSAIVHLVAEKYNLQMIDHRLSTSAPEDLTGLPFRRLDNGRAEFVPFGDLFPLEGDEIPEGKDGWLLFLDEFNSAPKSVLAAAYKLVLDRMTGQKKLHPNVAIVCAGNLMTDRAIVNNIGTALQSRLVHIEMEANHTVWLEDVALRQHWDSRVIAYLSMHPSKLNDFQPDHQDRTFCCPRTWDMVNKYLKTRPGALDLEDQVFIAGTISAEEAVSFCQFTKVFDKLVTLKDIIKDPMTAKLPIDNPSSWATCMSLVEQTDNSNYASVYDYVERMDMSFRVLYTRALMAQKPELRSNPRFGEACIAVSRHLHGN